MKTSPMKTISMQELHELLPALSPQELLLDVRTPEEFSEGHVPGSHNIPVDVVAQNIQDLTSYSKIYIYCRSGKRAQTAFHALTQKGIQNLICVAEGGMLDWVENRYPIETGA